jgi:DNA polymerase
MRISIDFETYSECDIRSAGAFAYAEHPTTEALCLAWAVDDEDPELWTPDMPAPKRLFDLIADGAEIWAWNSFFEMAVWIRCLKWPATKLSQWNDTAALACAQAYPRALGACGAALGLSEDQAKSKRGKLLIQRLCKPYRGKRNRDPELLQELYDYCLQDVRTERTIRQRLRPLNEFEQKMFEIDQRINWRGVRLDKASIHHALAIIEQVERESNERVKQITGGELASTASRAKSLKWIEARGYQMDSYDKAAVEKALSDSSCPSIVKEFLEIRQALSKSSTKKYKAMLSCLGSDERAHGVLIYHGAATGRWAGKHFQPQNLPRPTVDPLPVIRAMPLQDPKALGHEPMEALSSCLRGMLIPSSGHRLIAGDFASIEARVLAWMAGEQAALDAFVQGLDIYKSTASRMYGVNYDRVNSEQRFLGKVATLALGYQGGVKAFQKMAQAYGSEVSEEEALQIRDDWREANANVVSLWWNCQKAAVRAVHYKTKQDVRCGSFRIEGEDLVFELPSGRLISFPQAQISNDDFGRQSLTCQGMNNHTHRWGDVNLYGGSIVQSITQAIARDLLAEAVVRLEENGYRVVLTVHDEVVCDVPTIRGSLEEFEKLLCERPVWAKGLPIEAEAYEAERYRK